MKAKSFESLSWYFVQSLQLLCIGPSGFGTAGDWYELESATQHLENCHCVTTPAGNRTNAASIKSAVRWHAREVAKRWQIPQGAKARLEVPYQPELKLPEHLKTEITL